MAETATCNITSQAMTWPSILARLSFIVVALVATSLAIMTAGRWAGPYLALGGHSTSTAQHEIVIGNNVLSVPANMIRFPGARQDGVTAKLQLYLHWPDMTGYSDVARDHFNHVQDNQDIVFLTFEQQVMTRDMSGRFDPVYRALVEMPGRESPAGFMIYDFKPGLGYKDETLLVAERENETPFVARCLSAETAPVSLAPCERDIALGNGLSMTYRFAAEHALEWATLDEALLRFARSLLQTSKTPL